MQEQLLGYLMDALDPKERAQVEARLLVDPVWRAELARLRNSMNLLDQDPEHYDPPPGLAHKTCCWVWFRSDHACDVFSSAGRWKVRESLLTVGLCVATVMLLTPAIHQTRMNAQLLHCSDNLRQLGVALTAYSDFNQGFFPGIPHEGKLAGAGAYAPLLREAGFLSDSSVLVCPGSPASREPSFVIPTRREIEASEGCQWKRFRRWMGGAYGYTLGHVQAGKYCPPRNLGRSTFALASDAPSRHLPKLQSANHDGRGQNVLFEAGNVSFWRCPQPNPRFDCLFTNRHGYVAAGSTIDDSVIGDSLALPFSTALPSTALPRSKNW